MVKDIDQRDLHGYHSGFVTVVGRPNVGKSTLINALVGSKIAIASSRPETTRKAIRGIVTSESAQMVLVDTPGIHRPRTLLGQRLNDVVDQSLEGSDIVVMLLPADQKIGPGDKRILARLKTDFWRERREGEGSWSVPVIAVVTKIDTIDKQALVDKLIEVDQFGDFSDIVPLSALSGENVEEIKRVLIDRLPEGPQMYPENQVSEESVPEAISELVRETFLETLDDELPHSLAVVVDTITLPEIEGDLNETIGSASSSTTVTSSASEYTSMPSPSSLLGSIDRHRYEVSEDDYAHVYINIFVERESQKPIILGSKAEHLVYVKKKLRTVVNRMIGCKTRLHLHVKVAKSWQSDPKQLEKLGFSVQ